MKFKYKKLEVNGQMSNVKCRQRGVTLVELIVVLAVFAIVIGAAVDIFISIVQHQRRILAQQEFSNQISYVMEYMSRSMRMSIKDTAGTCLSGSPGSLYALTRYNESSTFYEGIKFIANNGVCQEFFLDRAGGGAVLKEMKYGLLDSQSILSSKFIVNYARFIINGNKNITAATQNDLLQPRITMVLSIDTQIIGTQQTKIFQTTVSQRNLNVP